MPEKTLKTLGNLKFEEIDKEKMSNHKLIIDLAGLDS